MTDSEPGMRGPIDFVLIEFKGKEPTGRTADALLDLVDRGIVTVYDLMLVGKSADGVAHRLDLGDGDPAGGSFKELAWARSGILSDDDMLEAAEVMEPGTLAALVVYENTWAIPFITAAWESGGQLVASGRLATQDVTDALDAMDSELTTMAGE
jgi:hypothetical protein